MSLTAIAFWALVVFAVVALFRGTRNDPKRARDENDEDAHRILQQRFARGEIDADEYHARQLVLRPTR